MQGNDEIYSTLSSLNHWLARPFSFPEQNIFTLHIQGQYAAQKLPSRHGGSVLTRPSETSQKRSTVCVKGAR